MGIHTTSRIKIKGGRTTGLAPILVEDNSSGTEKPFNFNNTRELNRRHRMMKGKNSSLYREISDVSLFRWEDDMAMMELVDQSYSSRQIELLWNRLNRLCKSPNVKAIHFREDEVVIELPSYQIYVNVEEPETTVQKEKYGYFSMFFSVAPQKKNKLGEEDELDPDMLFYYRIVPSYGTADLDIHSEVFYDAKEKKAFEFFAMTFLSTRNFDKFLDEIEKGKIAVLSD